MTWEKKETQMPVGRDKRESDVESRNQEPPFAGNSALIFGGAKGIGRAVALEWARRGARLAVADIDETAAQETAAEIVAAGGQAVALVANVLSEESLRAAANAAATALGDIGIVMNNVGALVNGYPQDIPISEWHRIMDLNYFGTVRSLELFLPKMLARGSGYIVNTASFAGLYPYAANHIPYAAAKAAVIGMTESLAIYLEPRGIHVSCLMPGPVLTNVLESMTSWTPECSMYGPGSELDLKLVDEVAHVLSDGMRDGKILIPTDAKASDIIKRWAASPDAFMRAKMQEFAAGEFGRPNVPEALREKIMAMRR
jgi:NAD(P)-dependent dehydrogenase (short-subunit alcohol dehydrogenase family)